MNRCQSLTKNNKRCRAIIKNNQLFCCKNHEPINNEIISEGCCMCMEKIESTKDIIYLNCKHAFHKPCYNEWLTFSTYEGTICIICRSNKVTTIPIKKKSKNTAMYNYFNMSKILNIQKILHNNFPKIQTFNINNINLINNSNNLIENSDDLNIDAEEININTENININTNNSTNNSTNNNTNNSTNNNTNNINIFINNYINNYINGNTIIYDGPNIINEINNINSIYNILNDD
jgi:hypothetical protein